MNTNSIVMIVVALFVALTLAAVVFGFSRKFRAERRLLGGASILEEVAADVQHGEDVRAAEAPPT